MEQPKDQEFAAEIAPYVERFTAHVREFDEAAMVLLKGHLVIEELLNEIIGRGVYHPDLMPRLDFSKKIQLARSMSLREQDDEMWKALVAVNELRNVLAHSLDPQRRKSKLDSLLAICRQCAAPKEVFKPEDPEQVHLAFACTFVYGFLSTFNEEMKRFRELVTAFDQAMNAGSRT
jgi:hypothetical protein